MTLSEKQFQNEVDYGTVMLLIKEWLAAGIINQSEFAKIEKLYAGKYNPIFRREARQN